MRELDVIMTGFTGDDETREMTENSLKSLRDSEGGEDFNIIFLESNPEAAPYDSVDVYVKPGFQYHCNKYYNIGVSHAISDYTAIVNNDTLFDSKWWTKMKKAMVDYNLDSASPRSTTQQVGLNPSVEMKHRYTPITKVVEGYSVAYTFCGWCWVIKKEVRDWLFPVDEQFSFFYNDNDVAKHLESKGCRHALVASSIVNHFGQKSHKVLAATGEYHKHTFGLEKNFLAKWGKY
jgi:GT2 family glycosyltransferase